MLFVTVFGEETFESGVLNTGVWQTIGTPTVMSDQLSSGPVNAVGDYAINLDAGILLDVGIGSPLSIPPFSQNDEIFTVLDLSTYTAAQLRYRVQAEGGGDDPEAGDDLHVRYVRQGNSFTLARNTNAGTNNNSFNRRIISLPVNALHPITLHFGNDGDLTARPTLNATAGADDWFVDDIIVWGWRPDVTISDATVTEGGVATFTVSLSEDTPRPVTVNYAVNSDSASSSDFSGHSGSVTFPANTRTQTIAVQTNQDDIDELNEDFQVVLSKQVDRYTISDPTGVGTIVDNDPAPQATVAVAGLAVGTPGQVNEGDSTTFHVTLDRPSSRDVTVNYATALGSASVDDFVSTSGTVTFTAQEMAARQLTKSITVTTTEDTIDEPSEAFQLVLSAPSNATLSANSSATVSIIDNDEMPTISVAPAIGVEGDVVSPPLTFDVTLSNPSSTPITVEYATVGQSAVADADFVSTAGTLTFAPGATTQSFSVALIPEDEDETDELFNVVLSNPSSNSALGTGTATGTITDDDATPIARTEFPGISITEDFSGDFSAVIIDASSTSDADSSQLFYSWDLGNDGTIDRVSSSDFETFGYADFAGAGLADGTVASEIRLSVSDGTNSSETIVSLDVINVAPEILTQFGSAVSLAPEAGGWFRESLLTGDASPTDSHTVTVNYGDGTIVTESFDPGVRTFALNHQYLAAGDYDVQIDVNDGHDITSSGIFTVSVALGSTLPEVGFATTDLSAQEGDSVTLTAILSSPATEDVWVPLVVSSPSQFSNTVLEGSVFDFAVGETMSTIQIDLIPDGVYSPDGTIELLMSEPMGAQLGANSVFRLEVANVDPLPTAEFSSSPFLAFEEGRQAWVSVILSNPTNENVVIPLEFSGSATQTGNEEFLFPYAEVNIPAGTNYVTIPYLILDDDLAEPAQTLNITMGTPLGATPGGNQQISILIPANDTPIVDLRAASLVVDEASGTSNVLVDLSNPIAQPVSVPFTISGTATDGSDFAYSPSAPLTFAANQTSAAIDLTIIDDLLVEPGDLESVVIEFGDPDVGLLGNTTLFELRIADNDQQTIQFVLDRQDVNEDSGSVTFNVVSNRQADVDIAIPVSVVLNSAEVEDLAGSLPTAVILPANATQTSFTIDIANDADNEPTESFTVFLGTPAGGGLLGENNFQQVTIRDDDPFAFISVEGDSFDELARTVDFTVQLTQPTNKNVDIDFATFGTARSGSDYTISPSNTITIPAGQRDARVRVAIRNDYTVEDNETMGVRLTDATHALVQSNLDRASIVIENNDIAKLSFATEGARYDEGTTFEVKVRLNKSLGDDLIVPVNAQSGSRRATPGSDYRLLGLGRGNTIRIPAGEREATFRVSITNDTEFELSERIVLSFGEPNLSTVQLRNEFLTFRINASDRLLSRRHFYNVGFGLDEVQAGQLIIDPDELPKLGPNDILVIATSDGTAIELSADDVNLFVESGQLVVNTGSNGNNTDTASGTSQSLAIGAGQLALDPNGDIEFVLLDPAKVLALPTGLANTNNSVVAGKINLSFASEQGNLFGSTAFFDANQNGIADFLDVNGDGIQQFGEPSEPSAITRLDGAFDLVLPTTLDGNGDGLIDSRDGRFVLTGGIDTGTELPMPLILEAAVGHYNISPLSTLAAKLVYDFGATDVVAEQRALNAFGIEGARFSDAQAVAAAGGGDAGAARLAIANAQIQGTTIAVGSLFTPLDGAPDIRVLGQLVFADMADKIQVSGSRLDLSSEVLVSSIIGGMEFQLGIALPADVRATAVEVIAASNSRLGALDTTSSSLLPNRAKNEVVFIGQFAPDLSQLASGDLTPADIIANYTGAAADARVEAAEHGLINPPRVAISSVRTPETDTSGVLQFEVHITGDVTRTVDVTYETVLDDAVEGEVTPVSGTLTWQPGDTSTRIIEVPFQGDTEFEADETVLLALTGISNAVLANDAGVGYILNDDALSFATPSNTDANEIELRIDRREAQLYVNQQFEFEGFHSGGAPSTITGSVGVDDSLIVELGLQNTFLTQGLHFQGNGDAGDILTVENSLASNSLHKIDGPGSGEFVIDGNLITYVGLANAVASNSPTIDGIPPTSFMETDIVSLSAVVPDALTDGDVSWHLSFDGNEVFTEDGTLFEYQFPDDGEYVLELRVETPGDVTSSTVVSLIVANVDPETQLDEFDLFEDDVNITLDVLSNDYDIAGAADPLRIVGVGNAIGSVIYADAQVIYNPNGHFDWLSEGELGRDEFYYDIDDGDGGVSQGIAQITIIGTNDAPVANAGGPYIIYEGDGLELDASASSDVDVLDVLTYTWDVDGDGDFDEGITGQTVTLTKGQLAALGLDDDADVDITVKVSDGYESATASTTLAVDNVSPQLNNLVITSLINEGEPATLSGDITDPGNDDFTLVVNWGDGTVDEFILPSGATAFSVTHPYRDDNPTGTPSDVYALEITIEDDDSGTGFESDVVTVKNVAPDFEAGTNATLVPAEAGQFSRTISFTDVGMEDTHSAMVDFGDGNGSRLLPINPGNSLDLNHTFTDEGTYTVSVTVKDDDTGVLTDTFEVAVQLNDPPVANDDIVTTDEDSPVAFDVLADNGNGADSDAQNNIVASTTTLIGAAPAKGTLVNNGDGTFTFDPSSEFEHLAAGQSEALSFTYQIEDAFGETSQAVVTITVAGKDDVPVMTNDFVSTLEDQPLTFDPRLNDTPFGRLTMVSTTVASNGNVVIGDDGRVVYTPNTNFSGVDSFEYTVSSEDGSMNTGVVTVDVKNLVDVSGRVFDDLDNDGAFEPLDGEVGLAGVRIQVWNDSLTELFGEVETSEDGSYYLDTNLHEGSYRIVEVIDELAEYSLLDGKETPGNLGGQADNSADSNEIGNINVGAPGTTPDAVDYLFGEIRPSDLVGFVWQDLNNNGLVDQGELPVEGAEVHLNGMDDRGATVAQMASPTGADGEFGFFNLRPSNSTGYELQQVQPVSFDDGVESPGEVNEVPTGYVASNDVIAGVVIATPGSTATNYNFGERPQDAGAIVAGQTAGIGFWNNKHGQQLIKELGGSPSDVGLGNWLAATLPNLYGDLAGVSNTGIAEYYQGLFKRNKKTALGGGPPKVDAQVMAAALNVYVTSDALAGNIAINFGFQVTTHGLSVHSIDVGDSGLAVGVSSGSRLQVIDLLLAVDERSLGGVLYDLDGDGDADDAEETLLRSLANDLFSAINEGGSI